MQPLAQTKPPHQEPAQNDIAPSIEELQYASEFIDRHIGPSNEQIAIMLASLKLESLEQLIKTVVPSEILTTTDSHIGNSITESQAIKNLKDIASLNKKSRSFIGLGYYTTRTPSVISRNVLQNPGWYLSHIHI